MSTETRRGSWYPLLTRGRGSSRGLPDCRTSETCLHFKTKQRAVNAAPLLTLLSQKRGSKRQISLLPWPLKLGTFHKGGAWLYTNGGSLANSGGLDVVTLLGVPGTDGCVLSPSYRVTWTDPSHCGFSFPGYRLPLLSPSHAPSPPSSGHPEVPWVSQHQSLPLSLRLLTCWGPDVPRLHSLTVALTVSTALGFSLSLPEPRALAGAEASLGPSRQGFGSSETGQLGTGQGVQGQTSCYILSQEPQFRDFFHHHASLGSCRSPGCQGFRFYFGAFFFKYVLGKD